MQLARRLNKIDTSRFDPLWVLDFPLFEWAAEEKRFVSVHHPFTSPHLEDVSLLDSDPGKVRSYGYDVVMNGFELGGGSIRIHDRALQTKVFETLLISSEEAEKKFGFLLSALE